jgi:hypothetical protein
VTARSREGDAMHRRNTKTSTESQDLYEAVYLVGRKEKLKMVGKGFIEGIQKFKRVIL